MVDVEIEVQDAVAGVASQRDRQGHVVVDAEARRATGHGVVQAAARVEGVKRVARQDRGHGRQGASCDRGRRLVHAGKGGIVARSDASFGDPVGVDREPLDGLDVGSLVEPLERSIVGRFRGHEPIRPERTQEIDTRSKSTRGEGVEEPEVVARRARTVDEQRPSVDDRWALASQPTGSQPAASTAARRATWGSVPASSAAAYRATASAKGGSASSGASRIVAAGPNPSGRIIAARDEDHDRGTRIGRRVRRHRDDVRRHRLGHDQDAEVAHVPEPELDIGHIEPRWRVVRPGARGGRGRDPQERGVTDTGPRQPDGHGVAGSIVPEATHQLDAAAGRRDRERHGAGESCRDRAIGTVGFRRASKDDDHAPSLQPRSNRRRAADSTPCLLSGDDGGHGDDDTRGARRRGSCPWT